MKLKTNKSSGGWGIIWILKCIERYKLEKKRIQKKVHARTKIDKVKPRKCENEKCIYLTVNLNCHYNMRLFSQV